MCSRMKTRGIMRIFYDNPEAVYACLNYSEAFAPKHIETRSIIIAGDTGEVLKKLNQGL